MAGSSWPIRWRATLTIVPSRKTTDEPRMAATIVQRWRVVIRAVCRPAPERQPASPGPPLAGSAGSSLDSAR